MSKVKNGGAQMPQTDGEAVSAFPSVAAYLLGKSAAAKQEPLTLSISFRSNPAVHSFIQDTFSGRGEKSDFVVRACENYLKISGFVLDASGRVVESPQLSFGTLMDRIGNESEPDHE